MISAQEFIARQDRLLAQCEPNSVCIIPAAGMVTRSRDTEYTFRQDSDFWYLTGFEEPNAWLMLSNHPRYGERYRAMVEKKKIRVQKFGTASALVQKRCWPGLV